MEGTRRTPPLPSTLLFLSALLAIFITACSPPPPVCTKPYITNGNTCCLDKDANAICDVDENGSLRTTAVDCSLCPPQFVTQKEAVLTYRYVCANHSIMETAEDCGARITSNAYLFTPVEDQDRTYIRGFAVTPACRGTYKAAELHLTVEQQPTNITFQYMNDPKNGFTHLGTINGKSESYYYVGFCKDCEKLTDAQLPADTAYLFRAIIRYKDRTIATREFIVDPTPEGDFGKKTC